MMIPAPYRCIACGGLHRRRMLIDHLPGTSRVGWSPGGYRVGHSGVGLLGRQLRAGRPGGDGVTIYGISRVYKDRPCLYLEPAEAP